MDQFTDDSQFNAEKATRMVNHADAVSLQLAVLATEAGIEILDPLHISVADLIIDCAARGLNPGHLMQRAEDQVSIAVSKEV